MLYSNKEGEDEENYRKEIEIRTKTIEKEYEEK